MRTSLSLVTSSMRDWFRTLPNASYRGSRFFVETERVGNAGREVAVHRFVKAETHATEDMGRKPWQFVVKAYTTGDTADIDAQAFLQVCSTAGASVLVLPIMGTYTARCTDADAVSYDTAKLGYVELNLKFTEAGNDSAFATLAIGDRIASNLLSGMAGVIGDAISAFAG